MFYAIRALTKNTYSEQYKSISSLYSISWTSAVDLLLRKNISVQGIVCLTVELNEKRSNYKYWSSK